MGKPGLASLSPWFQSQTGSVGPKWHSPRIHFRERNGRTKNFPNTVYFTKIWREAARRYINTWATKLGVYIDNSNIQGQGAEGQQTCHYCPGQQRCPAAQGTKMDKGPVGKKTQ